MPSDVDEYGIPLRGSALHIAYYVNCEPETLSAASLGSELGSSIEWRSPLTRDHFAEYKDFAFLDAVDRAYLSDDLADWWPESGPRWDALGVMRRTGGVVLVEAKANVPEIANGPACGSGRSGSSHGLRNRAKIERSLAVTRENFGISGDRASAWVDSHRYQYANRLAHLCFFELAGVASRLAHIYFTDDTTYISTTRAEFDEQRRADAEGLGMSDVTVDSATAAYLPARADAYKKLRSSLRAAVPRHGR